MVIDREAFSPPVLELLLLAEDIGLLNGTADLIVTILDDNDNWPTFSPAALTVHLLENCPPGEQAGPRQALAGGPWELEPHRLEQNPPPAGGQAAGWVERGLERESGDPGTPSLPVSDPQCLVCKTRLLRNVPGGKDYLKVKIELMRCP